MIVAPDAKKDIVSRLQKQILLLQGFTPPAAGDGGAVGLGSVEAVFPGGVFPKGAIHEFVSAIPEHAAVSGGFIGGLLKALMPMNGAHCLWRTRGRDEREFKKRFFIREEISSSVIKSVKTLSLNWFDGADVIIDAGHL